MSNLPPVRQKSGAGIILTDRAVSKAEPDMDSASVGSEVKPKVRVVTITVVVRSVVISIIVTPLPRIVTMVSVQPIVPLTIFVVVSVNRAIGATPCLQWRRPTHEKHCQKNGHHNFTDVFHCYPPFIFY